MRVLHVGKFFPPFAGGIERFTADLLPALAARGVHSLVVAHQHEFGRRSTREQVPGGELLRVRTFGRVSYAPVSPGFPAALAREIRAFAPDVIHAHLPNTSAFWLLAPGVAAGVPLVLHWHADVVASRLDRKLALFYPGYRIFEQRLLQRAALVAATSPPYLESSRALAPFRDKCRVVPLGIDPGRISQAAGATPDLPPGLAGRPLVLSVGRFTYYKGYEHLIRAAALLPEAGFALVGEGELRPAMVRLAERLGVSDRVWLPGRLPGARLDALFENCDLFCLPSVERTEAFGVVLLEAMARAKPLVTSRLQGSGVMFVNREGETGLMARPGDPEDLASALRSLAGDAQRRRIMGQAARSRLQERFTMDRIAPLMLDLYTCAAARGDSGDGARG